MITLFALLLATLNPASLSWPAEPVVPELDFTTIESEAAPVDPSTGLIEFQTRWNDLITAGDETAFWDHLAAHLYPQDGWTGEQIRCVSLELGAAFDAYPQTFYNTETLTLTPEWSTLPGNYPGAGQVPDGDTYAVSRQTGLALTQRHVTVGDSGVLIFLEPAIAELTTAC